MNKIQRKLLIEQVDQKFQKMKGMAQIEIPSKGWIYTLCKAMNLPISKLAYKMKKKPPTLNEMLLREENGTITLKKLKEAAEALDMKFVYAFIPNDGTLSKLIERKASEKASAIVMRTSQTMKLENQETEKARIEKAIDERTRQFIDEVPKILWD
mgnify:CR=1 FL=1